MAKRQKKEEANQVKSRKRPERMGPDFFDLLLDNVELIAQAKGELARAGEEFKKVADSKNETIEGSVEDRALRVVGAARRLDVTISNARVLLRGTTFSGIAIDRFKDRLDQAEQISRNGWALVEYRF